METLRKMAFGVFGIDMKLIVSKFQFSIEKNIPNNIFHYKEVYIEIINKTLKRSGVMTSTLSSLAVFKVVMTTTSPSAACDHKVGIMTTLSVQFVTWFDVDSTSIFTIWDVIDIIRGMYVSRWCGPLCRLR